MNQCNVNPIGFAYKSLANIAQYGQPGGKLVVSENFWLYGDPALDAVRKAGCKVLAYFDTVEKPDDLTKVKAYGTIYAAATLWKYPTPGIRINYPNTHLADITIGSSWCDAIVAQVQDMMVRNLCDGVFLDVQGGRLWSKAPLSDWDNWPQSEKDAWTAGCIDLARRLDELRRRINPRFIIVNNNTWDRSDGMTWPNKGEQYVDGIGIEHHTPDPNSFTGKYAARTFAQVAQRTVIIMAKTLADAQAWALINGVTNVMFQPNYDQVLPPCVPFVKIDNTFKS